MVRLHVCYEVPADQVKQPPLGQVRLGLDRNVGQATDSDGEVYAMPDDPELEAQIKRKQRELSRKPGWGPKDRRQPKSNRGRRVNGQLQKLHRKRARKRDDATHQASRKLADTAHTVVVEDLNTKAMTRSRPRARWREPGRNVKQKAGLNRGHPGSPAGAARSASWTYKAGAPAEGATGLHVADLCGVRTRQQGESQDTGTLPMHGVRTHCERRPQCRPKHPGAGSGPAPEGPRDWGFCTCERRSIPVCCLWQWTNRPRRPVNKVCRHGRGVLLLGTQVYKSPISVEHEPDFGLSDSGNLEIDLQALFEVAGEAAKKGSSALVLLTGELQYVPKDQLGALIDRVAPHRATAYADWSWSGAGLPQLWGRIPNAKSYAERLFDFPEIGPLSRDDAGAAIAKPTLSEGVLINSDALDEIVAQPQGYPYFLQEWGKHVWDIAETSPITPSDVVTASQQATAALDASFFLVRFDRLTPSEKRYLRAMAQLGAGPHRSGEIAQELHRQVQSLAPTRSKLIGKGMIWSPGHGDTAFTVPMFDEFMRCIMPDDE